MKAIIVWSRQDEVGVDAEELKESGVKTENIIYINLDKPLETIKDNYPKDGKMF